MLGRVLAEERMNVFALVVYVPPPLGQFLDDLRLELVPHCNPHAHVSVLPPRPLAVDWREACEQVRALIESWNPFDVELGGIERFPVTNVIYIGLHSGVQDLRRIHRAMNAATLAFDEPFPFHPHVTLAQEIPLEEVAACEELARRRWAEYKGPRTFRIDNAVFVQNTLNGQWIDLAEHQMGLAPVKF